MAQFTAKDAKQFEATFHVPLKNYWHGNLLGFDVTGFDTDVIKSGNQSMKAAVQQTYGMDAVKLIEKLLGMESR